MSLNLLYLHKSEPYVNISGTLYLEMVVVSLSVFVSVIAYKIY